MSRLCGVSYRYLPIHGAATLTTIRTPQPVPVLVYTRCRTIGKCRGWKGRLGPLPLLHDPSTCGFRPPSRPLPSLDRRRSVPSFSISLTGERRGPAPPELADGEEKATPRYFPSSRVLAPARESATPLKRFSRSRACTHSFGSRLSSGIHPAISVPRPANTQDHPAYFVSLTPFHPLSDARSSLQLMKQNTN